MERKNNRSEMREMTSKNRTSQPISWPISLITFIILFVLRLKVSSYSCFEFFWQPYFTVMIQKRNGKQALKKNQLLLPKWKKLSFSFGIWCCTLNLTTFISCCFETMPKKFFSCSTSFFKEISPTPILIPVINNLPGKNTYF